jgi:hypothetical protein
MLRDANQNVAVNRLNQSNTSTTAAGATTALTAASSYIHTLVGTGGQTYTMPDATTLTTGVAFLFNNRASGTLTLQDFAAGPIGTIAAGGAAAVFLTANGTVAGTWDLHGYLPEGVTWGTNALNLGSTVISNGTWQGGTIDTAYGGTGLTTFAAANNALYSTSASALTAGTLPVAAGGTGVTTSTGATSVVLSDSPALTGTVTIGSTTGASTVTLGQSTGTSTVNIATGVTNAISSKTINIATNGTGGTDTINIGRTAVVNGVTNINIGTQQRASNATTININTGATGGNANTTIGSGIGGSLTQINGPFYVSGDSNYQVLLGSPTSTGNLIVGQSTVSQTTSIQTGATASGSTKTINIGTGGLTGSTTTIAVGSTIGTTTTVNGIVNVSGLTASQPVFTDASKNLVSVATVPIANGGTNSTATATAGGIGYGTGTAHAYTTAGTSGQVLTSAGAGVPTWTTPTTGTVTSVTGTSPVASSGGATPAISLSANYGDTLNPYASKTANFVLAAPNGAAGVPTFRAVVAADIPTLNQNTTGTASNVTGNVAILNGGTGATTALAGYNALSPMTTLGDITYEGAGASALRLGIGSTNQVLTVVGGVPAWASLPAAGVTSIAGTTNQITASASTGAVTLSTPSTFIAPGSIAATTTVTGTILNATSGFILNGLTISSSYTIAASTGAHSVGPMTINSGVTVTVSSGSRWVVL